MCERIVFFSLLVAQFLVLFIYLAVGAVGTVGNSTFFCRVFQALWERWKNAVCFSTVSIARQFP